MRTFSDWEQKIISNLCDIDTATPLRIEQLLNTFYFKEEEGRALIIQSKAHYAVFFLAIEHFNDESYKKNELQKFFELILLLRWLKDNGYIMIFHATPAKEKLMYFLQDDFRNAQPTSGTIVLNSKGYNTSAPDTIHDKHMQIVYKGVVFDSDTYEMIMNVMVGDIYISEKIKGLVVSDHTIIADNENASVSKSTPKDTLVTKESVDEKPQDNNENKSASDGNHHTILPEEKYSDVNTISEKKSNRKMKIVFVLLVLIKILLVGHAFYTFKTGEDLHRKMSYIVSRQDSLEELYSYDIHLHEQATAFQKNTSPSHYYGIDISHWNGNIVKDINNIDSITFAICKATEGVSATDPSYHRNIKLIKDKGVISGAYHFYLTSDSPIEQAQHFYNVVHQSGNVDMPLIIDVEELSLPVRGEIPKQTVVQDILKFLHHLENLTGTTPMIYTDYSFANEYLSDTVFSNYPLWLTEYTSTLSPQIPVAWKNNGYKIWQKSNRMDISSYTVDYDIYYGSKAGLYN